MSSSSSSGQRTLPRLFQRKKQIAATLKSDPSSSSSLEGSSRLLTLCSDLQVYILRFLDEHDVCRVSLVNRHFWLLLQSGDSHEGTYVYQGLAEQRWPFLVNQQQDHCYYSLDAASSFPMSHLLRWAAPNTPTHVDQSLFSVLHLEFVQAHGSTETKAVRYTGRVGQGSRSVLANAPLPRPLVPQDTMHKRKGSLCQRLKNLRGRRQQAITTPPKPFVVPYRLATNNDGCFAMTPRWIAYYEASILPGPIDASISVSRTECIAVGLSAHNSSTCANKMPGWAARSFGYHSDDGTSFSNGIATKHYGPCFGVGDVVGCGIDYQTKAVFYTLNGLFLGYVTLTAATTGSNAGSSALATKDAQWQHDWFPTIGLDTSAIVQCNFGTEQPFVYDLTSMIKMANCDKTSHEASVPNKTQHSCQSN